MIDIVDHVLRQVRLPATEKLMLVALANHASVRGTCFPSVNTLADTCCISERHAHRVLAKLRDLQLLRIDVGAGRRGTNLYTITVDWLTPDAQVTSHDTDVTLTAESPPLTLMSLPPDARVIPSLTPASPEPSLNRQETSGKKAAPRTKRDRVAGAALAPAFDVFWTAYPKKVGKDAAIKAFAKRKPDPLLVERMLSAIDEQSRSEQWRTDGGKFIPHPATWLSQGRWADEPMRSGAAPDDIFAGAL